MDALQLLVKGTVVLFVVSSMLSIGLAARWTELIAPMARPFWMLRALGSGAIGTAVLFVVLLFAGAGRSASRIPGHRVCSALRPASGIPARRCRGRLWRY
jgi:hypothetical protein